ncbi:sigma 54-interacting transcriptional regulator [Anaerosinus massiliensis]|uniref:sigma 54-interacting transcriptional regulator n=1 Tax=Massilibacillus massiliensis TaxID=1806837 RepID=UPI000A3FC6FD|nr:sigma 54-interacting transcriptional regulator [Massilibacillus massiliensis]
MLFERQATIKHKSGVHARVAAMIVQKSIEIYQKYKCKMQLRTRQSERLEIQALMPIVALKIVCGDVVWVSAKGEKAEQAVEAMVVFLESDFTVHTPNEMRAVDQLLHENAFTAEQIFANMANGLIVTNQHDIITVCNPAAARIIGIHESAAIGKNVEDVVPNTRLNIVNKTGEGEIASRQMMGKSLTITNRTPIVINGEVRGAIAVFEDISALEKIKWEFYEVKELQERLQLILESVQDGICVVSKTGEVNYVNSSYLRIVHREREQVLGTNVYEVAPNGTRCSVLKTGKPEINSFSKKRDGTMVVANVNPIMIDGEISGVVSVIKNITEVQNLMEKLSTMSAKAEYLEQELMRTKKTNKAFENYIGSSGRILDVLAMATKAAESTATVLIRGESGTGKELVAEGIHYASHRSKGPFIRVNCGAIPSALLESELFGHEKGAFTGAVKRKLGKFELANHGTIFLDEIGEMDKNMQVKLLRALQQKEFDRVGGENTIKVDVRIIAATNRSLEEMVRQGTFRDDLYYRLNVIPLFLPPLRERVEDIPLLTEHFIKKINEQSGKQVRSITPEALEVLMAYKWPGNVRELENIIERVITLMESDYIAIEHLPSYITGETVKREVKKFECGAVLPWEEYEKQIISNALKRCGSFNAASKMLKLTHKTVATKAKKYGLV